MDFVALDVETANPFQGSICQIGIVVFKGGKITDEFETLVNPNEAFGYHNIRVHGIQPEMVLGAPEFVDVYEHIRDLMDGQVIVHHSPFDKNAIAKVSDKYKLEHMSCRWLDSAEVARKAFGKKNKQGLGLRTLCEALGIAYENAHNALCDARACGELLVKVLGQMNVDGDWIRKNSCLYSDGKKR